MSGRAAGPRSPLHRARTRTGAGRRRFLAAAASALALPALVPAAPTAAALARFPHAVPDGLIFFVGNSFTRQHAIPALVCSIAASTGTRARCHPHTANGAWLEASADFARLILAERGTPLPATVVLQDHSIAPLTPSGRRRSATAIEAWAAAFERTVLFETWPRRAGHPLYGRRNRPASPQSMVEIVHDHYARSARRLGAATAPVGRAWLEAETRRIGLYAADGYHANLAGAWLAATMLARALDLPRPYSAPPPDGLAPDTARRLAGIAARHEHDPDQRPLQGPARARP